jgi:hypothetical protein
MVFLILFLLGEVGAGREVLTDYMDEVKRGRDVSATVAGEEAASITELLRKSSAIEVDNFQSQAGTSCFWVTIKHDGAKSKAVFVLADRESGTEVIACSLARGCECPDQDIDKKCSLR